MSWQVHQGGVRALWSAEIAADAIGIAWLGQASFALRVGPVRLLIDPYFAGWIAKAPADKSIAHVLRTSPPTDARFFTDLDWVLCSHEHSDHMDREALPLLASASPRCRFVVPAAERATAIERCGLHAERLVTVDAGDGVDLGHGVSVKVTPAAHEDRKRNARGEHHFIGFALRSPAGVVWHSGDTIPFDDLPAAARDARVGVALLPVNGRDAERTSRGIIGNMDFAEARALCVAAGIPRMVPHHFGLFEGNTVPLDVLDREVAQTRGVACALPRIDEWYELRRD